MLWDVFCRVIDNFGDIGVCWRLACDLGERGHAVRLWVDDPAALAWMAPQVSWHVVSAPGEPHQAHPVQLVGLSGLSVGCGQTGVTVLRWEEAERNLAVNADLQAGDVVIEAFGCNPPEAFVTRMQRPAPPTWINLEYLSAEAYVERSHGLPSPVGSGPGRGLVKRFHYPGFTTATGGLLREPGLLEARQAQCEGSQQRQETLRRFGVNVPHEATIVSVFCYASAPVAGLLDRLAVMAAHGSARPIHILLTPGHAQALANAWAQQQPRLPDGVRLHSLPPLSQSDFDCLLWCCDLNFVRGEDSAVRALWAGKPHIWQIYEQDDGVHAGKLDAFMARWMADWTPPLRASVTAWWRAWNGLGDMPDTLPDWLSTSNDWGLSSQNSRAKLTIQTDLTTQLIQFVMHSG